MANANVTIVGNVTRDPELRYANSGVSVARDTVSGPPSYSSASTSVAAKPEAVIRSVPLRADFPRTTRPGSAGRR